MHAPLKCMQLTSLYGINTRYVQCSTVHEYIPTRQAIWVVQVVLITSNECGCVTMQELFGGGGVIFFNSRKHSRAGLIQGREEIKEIQYKNHAMLIEQNHSYTLVHIHVSTKSSIRPSVISFSVLQVNMESVNFSGNIVYSVQLLGSIATSSQRVSIAMWFRFSNHHSVQ